MMLVLSRKDTERIFIGDTIIVTVVKIQGGVVRLGIEAPPNILIAREELRGTRNETLGRGPA
jgi:carbon storage regulator